MASQINQHSVACKTLARTALMRSGINRKTLADAMGKDEATLSRYLSDQHEHEMGHTTLMIFEAMTGDRTVMDYIERELGRIAQEIAS